MVTSGAARTGPLTSRTARASAVAIQFGAVVILVGTAAPAGFAAARNPIIAILAFFGLLTVMAATTNVLMAVALLSASFFFENYLAGGAGFLTPAKAVGVVAAGAWVLEWARKREPAMTVPHVWWIAGLNIWVIASLAVAVDEKQAVIFATRYVLFFALFFLVVQTV